MFSEEQVERLRSFPDIGKDDLIRYFTLAPADVNRKRCCPYRVTAGQANLLGIFPGLPGSLAPR